MPKTHNRQRKDLEKALMRAKGWSAEECAFYLGLSYGLLHAAMSRDGSMLSRDVLDAVDLVASTAASAYQRLLLLNARP